jgi:hypothetical protein
MAQESCTWGVNRIRGIVQTRRRVVAKHNILKFIALLRAAQLLFWTCHFLEFPIAFSCDWPAIFQQMQS